MGEVENEYQEARARCLADPECATAARELGLPMRRRVRRQAELFPGIPQFAWDGCKTSMTGATIAISHPAPDGKFRHSFHMALEEP
jgi:hypothetical protein